MEKTSMTPNETPTEPSETTSPSRSVNSPEFRKESADELKDMVEKGPHRTGPGKHDRGLAEDRPLEAAPAVDPRQSSLVTPEVEKESRTADQSGKDKLLHDQLTAQLASGGPVKPPDLKPAENLGLFGDNGPEPGNLFGGEKGGISPELLTLGAEKFWKDDVAPKIAAAARTIRDTADDILKVLAPQLRSPEAQQGGLMIRHEAASLARRTDQAQAALKKHLAPWIACPRPKTGNSCGAWRLPAKQKTPELQKIADVFHDLLEDDATPYKPSARASSKNITRTTSPTSGRNQSRRRTFSLRSLAGDPSKARNRS